MTAWVVYHRAKGYLADGTIDLDSDAINMVLATSGSNAADLALSARSQLTLVVSGTDRTVSAQWIAGVSAGQMKFTSPMQSWMGPLDNVRHVVCHNGSKVITVYTLDAATSVPDGTSFNVVVSNIFTLT